MASVSKAHADGDGVGSANSEGVGGGARNIPKIPKGKSKHSRGRSLVDRQLRNGPAPDTNEIFRGEDQRTENLNEEQLQAMVSTFDSDKIVKNGWLHKRNKAKQWQRRWFVLRDHQLVYYKDEQEYRVVGIVNTADIMTVAMVTDAHKPNHFVIFTSSNNIHLRADNTPDAQDWCDVIRQIADESAESLLSSSFQRMSMGGGGGGGGLQSPLQQRLNQEKKETLEEPEGISFPNSFHSSHNGELASQGTTEYSGHDDLGLSSVCTSENFQTSAAQAVPASPNPQQSNHEQGQEADGIDDEEEKIVKKGPILRLKKHYNQWKHRYMILTTQRLVVYKSEKHAEPVKIVPLHDLIDVVETDPLSRSKRYCMITITAEKRTRYCAESEEDLTKWLASFKSVLAKHT